MSKSEIDRMPTDSLRLPDNWNVLLVDDENTLNKSW